MESILKWAEEIGDGVDDMAPEQRRNVLLGVVEGITIDRHNEVNITLAVPVDDSLSVDSLSPPGTDRYAEIVCRVVMPPPWLTVTVRLTVLPVPGRHSLTVRVWSSVLCG